MFWIWIIITLHLIGSLGDIEHIAMVPYSSSFELIKSVPSWLFMEINRGCLNNLPESWPGTQSSPASTLNTVFCIQGYQHDVCTPASAIMSNIANKSLWEIVLGFLGFLLWPSSYLAKILKEIQLLFIKKEKETEITGALVEGRRWCSQWKRKYYG